MFDIDIASERKGLFSLAPRVADYRTDILENVAAAILRAAIRQNFYNKLLVAPDTEWPNPAAQIAINVLRLRLV